MRSWPVDTDFASTCWAWLISVVVSSESMWFACAQASLDESRLIVCSLMPNRSLRPASSASSRILASFLATCCGGSPQVRYTSTYFAATGPAASDDPPK